MNKQLAIALFCLVVLALGGVFYYGWQREHNARVTANQATLAAKQILSVKGLIGSEKEDFFKDPQVQAILKDKYKLIVDTESVGSRRIATDGGSAGKANQYDFAFPAGTPAADKIKREFKPKDSYRVFFTPMAVASWTPVAQVLENNNIVQKSNQHYRVIDMPHLLALMENKTRWQDLPNNDGFAVGRKVLIKSTNIASSNSAAMYLSLASYLANNNDIVTTPEQVNAVLPKVAPLFTTQGYMAGSSATPFDDYLSKGMGDSPLVMIYEAQFLAQAGQGGIRPNMVLLYPEPTIFTQHTLLAMTDSGKRLGEALTQDADLQKLAIKHGFRSNNPALAATFSEQIRSQKLDYVPDELTEVINTPSYEVLETMIGEIERQLK